MEYTSGAGWTEIMIQIHMNTYGYLFHVKKHKNQEFPPENTDYFMQWCYKETLGFDICTSCHLSIRTQSENYLRTQTLLVVYNFEKDWSCESEISEIYDIHSSRYIKFSHLDI